MRVVIIKYNAGNIQSMDFALQRLGIHAEITSDEKKIREADKVIFPGVGEASSTMAYLKMNGLDKLICNLVQPVLGVCLGLQLMCSRSEEGDVDCLGIFDEKVRMFTLPLDNNSFKVPHMGWNLLKKVKGPVFGDECENAYVYFVHSYYASVGLDTSATSEYIVPFSAGLQKANFYACQFHPEKSGLMGARLLENFLNL
jgi:imidazole glycerol-phosphate synthase subunit HisH